MMQTIFEGVQTFLENTKLDFRYWTFIIKFFVWTYNCLSLTRLDNKTIYEFFVVKNLLLNMFVILVVFFGIYIKRIALKFYQKFKEGYLCLIFRCGK